MESTDENGVNDLMEKRKLSHEHASSVLKERYLSGVIHPSLRKVFVAKGVYLKKCQLKKWLNCFTVTTVNFINDIFYLLELLDLWVYKVVYAKCFQRRKLILFCDI